MLATSTINKLVLGSTLVLMTIFFLGAQFHIPSKVLAVSVAGVVALISTHFLLWNKKAFVLLLFAAIPFSVEFDLPGTGFTVSMPAEIMIAVLAAILLARMLFSGVLQKVLRHPLTIIILLDVLWLLVTTATSTDIGVSLKRVIVRGIFLVFGYFFMFHWFKDPKAILKPILLYTLGASVVVILIVWAHAQYGFSSQVAFAIPQPYFDEHTVYAACLTFLLPVLFLLVKRPEMVSKNPGSMVWILVVTGIISIGLLLSYSRAAWLSLLLGLGFWQLLKWKVKPVMYAALLGAVLVTAFVFQSVIYENIRANQAVSNDGNVANHVTSVTNVSTDASNLERINRWVCALRMFQQKPLTGFGPGTYQFEYARFQTSEYTTYISTTKGDRGNAHSEYLMYLSETGIFGLIIFLIMVIYTLYLGIRNNLRTEGYIRAINNALVVGLVTFFFHGIFNSFIDQDKMAMLVFSSMAAIAAIDTFHAKKKTKALETSS